MGFRSWPIMILVSVRRDGWNSRFKRWILSIRSKSIEVMVWVLIGLMFGGFYATGG